MYLHHETMNVLIRIESSYSMHHINFIRSFLQSLYPTTIVKLTYHSQGRSQDFLEGGAIQSLRPVISRIAATFYTGSHAHY